MYIYICRLYDGIQPRKTLGYNRIIFFLRFKQQRSHRIQWDIWDFMEHQWKTWNGHVWLVVNQLFQRDSWVQSVIGIYIWDISWDRTDQADMN